MHDNHSNTMKYKYILDLSQITSRLLLATLILISAGCSWSDPYTQPQESLTGMPIPGDAIPNTPQSGHENIDQTSDVAHNSVVRTALNQLGTPYRYGGNNPDGFDCSGLVQYSHFKAGINVPRTTEAQLNYFREIPRSKLRSGDLAFFKTGRKQFHVAIMISAREFVHAPSSGKTVSISNFSNPYWKSKFIRAGRL